MTRAYLIVHDVSYGHVRNVAHFIHRRLQHCFGAGTALIRAPEIDAAEHDDGAFVFVIGENFRRHRRRPGCRYVYLNFSVVELMGNPLMVSREGWSALRRKRRMLLEKVDLYDAVLDYFPPQTRRLRRRLPQPVFGFPAAVDPCDLSRPASIEGRDYDVCFVGSMSPRRRAVLEDLGVRGLRLSPTSGVVFEDVAARSKICLNVHAFRSNHLETPRIVGALASGTPVLTEKSFGLGTLVPAGMVETAPPSRIAQCTEALVADGPKLRLLHDRSRRWYKEAYHPRSVLEWEQVCRDLVSML